MTRTFCDVASDVNPDDVLHHIDQAVRYETGRTIHRSTGIRWATKGRGGVRLKAVRMGRYLMTTRKAVREYLAALTAAEPDLVPPTIESDRDLSGRAAAAKRRAAEALS